MSEEKGKCERCGNMAMAVKSGLPRVVHFCTGCWNKFSWARRENWPFWEKAPEEFLNGIIRGTIPVYPDNDDFKRRLAIRALYRMRDKRVRQATSLKMSARARKDDFQLASEFLSEPFEQLNKVVRAYEAEADDRFPSDYVLETRLRELLRQDPIFNRYLKNINDLEEGTPDNPRIGGMPGVVAWAGLIGEIGAVRTLLCPLHQRAGVTIPQPWHQCEHGRGRELEDLLSVISSSFHPAYGVEAFPTSGMLRAFFGLGFQDTGMKIQKGGEGSEQWSVRARPAAGEDLNISLRRKTLAVQFLAGQLERKPRDIPPTPWQEFYAEEKVRKFEQWREWFKKDPPPVCTACLTKKCPKCHGTGEWEKSKNEHSGLWVCQHHDGGYWFGSPNHLRYHALGKTASLFLDLLWHIWRYVDGVSDDPPRHPLAKMYI